MRRSNENFVILTVKTDAGREKLGYHGDKWKLLAKDQKLKFSTETHSYARLLSRDGSKLMFVREKDDPDFEMREV